MFAEALLAAAFQVGPFYEQRAEYRALRPFWSEERETTDVLWPLFSKHRDWWRFCFLFHEQDQPVTEDGVEPYQLEIMPLWFNGRTRRDENYWGLFPIYGSHPHILLLDDVEFALWPLWMRYTLPKAGVGRDRARGDRMTTHAVLFPFVHWRDDGSWGGWPIYGVNHARESDHRYALWPIATWASYRADRDTAGAGSSWMFWPIWADVSRERESQWMFLPPLFGHAKTPSQTQLRCPWPIFEVLRGTNRDRTSVFPLVEHETLKRYADGAKTADAWRFGWRLVEWYRDGAGRTEETRVFPFWVRGGNYFRLWPFWESATDKSGTERSRLLALLPIRWADAVDRNWAKYWTFYERERTADATRHALFWGIIRWTTGERKAE